MMDIPDGGGVPSSGPLDLRKLPAELRRVLEERLGLLAEPADAEEAD